MRTARTETPDALSREAPPPRAAAVMAVLLLIFFLGTSDNQMISPLLPLIAGEYGLEVGAVGEKMGPAYALAAALAALFIGPLSDRMGRRRFLLYAALLFAASLMGAALVRGRVEALAALRVLTGLAAGTFSTCAIAYVADYFPYARRGVAMSVVQAGYFLALVLGVPVASLLASWQGWRASFIFFGGLAVAAFLLVLTLLPEDRHLAETDLGERVARRFDNIRLVFEKRDRVASIVAAFLVSCGFVGFIFYLGAWLVREFGFTTRGVGLFFIVVGVASFVGAIVAGKVADRLGKRAVSVYSTLVLAAMLALIPSFDWGVLLFVTFLLASLAFAFRQGPLQALATELVPRRARGALVAVRNTASQIGIAVSTAACGALFDAYGYAAVGWFCGGVTLAAVPFIFLMGEPRAEAAPVE